MVQKNKAEKKGAAYGHILKYTGLFGGVQGVNLLATIVRNKLASELLGPAGLGLVSLFNTATSLVGNATNFGVPFSAVRHVAELYEAGDEAELKRFVGIVRGWSIAAALLGVLVCCLCAPLLCMAYDAKVSWESFVWISPVVGLTALAGGELAILKGIRRLRQVAVQSLLNSLLAIVLTIPLYYFWGASAIVASLLLLALSTWLTTFYFSYCAFPFFPLSGKNISLVGGGKMVKLGLAFILAGILGSGVEFIVRAYMLSVGSEAEVGLYNAGYMITVTYASMVFVAMETDFFPRLSAVNQDVLQSNEIVNRQIEVSILLVSPLLVAFLVGLPLLVPLLYSSEFMPVVGMAQCAVFSMYMRAVALPISYLSLAKGRSRVYLFTEAVYDVAAVVLLVAGYSWGGLRGAGIALSVAAAFDLVLVWLTCRRLYAFRLFGGAFRMLALQLPLGVATWLVVFFMEGWCYWLVGCVCILCSSVISLRILYRETTVLQIMGEKLKRRFTHSNPDV